MNKKVIIMLAIFMMICSRPALHASEPERSVGISISAGSMHSVNGTLKDNSEMRDITSAGPGLGIAVEKWIGSNFKTGITAYLSWVSMDEDVYPENEGAPAFSLMALIFRNSYHFTGRSLRPFISTGAGLYNWTISQDGPSGDPITFEGEDMQKISIGVTGGGGVEYRMNLRFSFTLEVNYSYILSRDTFHFGENFSAQGVAGLNLGISYFFLSH